MESLLSSTAIRVLSGLLQRPVAAAFRVGGFLAAATVRFTHRRLAGMAAPLAVGIAIAGWALAGLPLFAMSNAQQVADRFDADYVITTPIVRDTHTGLSPQAVAALSATPAVATAGLRQTWLQTAKDGGPATATWSSVVTGDAARLLDLGDVQGDLARLDSGIALGAENAARGGVALGDTVQVRLPGAAHPVALEVVALFSAEGGDQGAVVSQQALGQHVAAAWFDYVLVSGEGEPQQDSLQNALWDALGGGPGSVTVQHKPDFLASYIETRRAAVDNLGTIAVVLVGIFLVLAAANALGLSVADRTGEVSALRRLNATAGQVRSMIAWEMALTVGPAWLLGAAATGWMAFAMASGDLRATVWAYPLGALSLVGAAGLLWAVVGSLATIRGRSSA
ncbi:hypothetical protein BJY21_000295 [Kineosphaera limosa]|uniref:Putative ABC transporter permease protein n=1 Tax=Kineosphaera limosa NBRC 100340 TaxID=1184609 RepID=K6XCI7_9MICO|nr:ABC transporter permease [Kineosphaera limosa]NYD99110.1 hypothetical protein [Kineosphaera limosa]GAB96529.1 putative ABC transporter permease protein [Kineosphaera limosa NBRC 100340]